MLREAISAADDDARLLADTVGETAGGRHYLGAHLDGVSPAFRDAALVRSRRLPEADTVRAAWRQLPASTQERFGAASLTRHFYNVICQDTGREVTLDACQRGAAAVDQASAELDQLAFTALPELYGTDDAEPAWALSDTPLSFPDPYGPVAPTEMPPRVRVGAIARSRRIPGLDAIVAAWSRLPPAKQDLLGVQAVAFAFYGWLTEDNAHAPADRWLTDRAVGQCVRREDKHLRLLGEIAERSLPELFGTRKKDPAWTRLDADPAALEAIWEAALPSPALSAIALHRAAWRTLLASAASLKARGEWEWRRKLVWPAQDAEDESVTDLLMTACRDRADAKAMLHHLRWYQSARPQHPNFRGEGNADDALIAVRLRDLAMILGRDVAGAVEAPGAACMAGLVAEHRATWNAYLTDPDALVRGSDRRLSLRDAVGLASEAVLVAPCADWAEAAVFVGHAEWVRVQLEAAGESLADGFEYEAQQMRARAGDLSLLLANTSR